MDSFICRYVTDCDDLFIAEIGCSVLFRFTLIFGDISNIDVLSI